MGRERITTDNVIAWINNSVEDLSNPEEPIEYGEVLEPYDLEYYFLLGWTRMSTICNLCLRKAVYAERYPMENQEGYPSALSLSALIGTGFHALPHLRRLNPVYEKFVEYKGITGHIDIWLPEQRVIIDIKTTSRLPDDPRPKDVKQVSGYYAVNNLVGDRTEQVFLWYVNRCAWFKAKTNHRVFEIVFDHEDHAETGLPAHDASRKKRTELCLGWSIDETWEKVSSWRDAVLKGREGILPPRMPENDDFKHYLCQSCPFREGRCKLDAL